MRLSGTEAMLRRIELVATLRSSDLAGIEADMLALEDEVVVGKQELIGEQTRVEARRRSMSPRGNWLPRSALPTFRSDFGRSCQSKAQRSSTNVSAMLSAGQTA